MVVYIPTLLVPTFIKWVKSLRGAEKGAAETILAKIKGAK